MGPLSALFLMGSAAAAAPPLTVAEMKSLPPAKLASRLLPPDQAARVVGGSVGRVWLPGQVYGATFWEAAVPLDGLLCTRRQYYVEAANLKAVSSPDDPATPLGPKAPESVEAFALSFPAKASRANCSKAKGYTRPRPEEREDTLAALRQLAGLMRAAGGKGPLPFDLTCRQEPSIAEETADREKGMKSDWRSCGDDRAALANLPLDVLFGVRLEDGSYAVQSVTPTKNGAPAIVVRRRVPTPQPKPTRIEYAFGPSGPDGRSWRVSTRHAGGRTSVEMKRTTVIYH